jgi:hypothetical protein
MAMIKDINGRKIWKPSKFGISKKSDMADFLTNIN